ncbi:acetyltransferase (GNAT) family protein [Mariniflexile fucanivorans]|uniref:Acetyltransferase (GNAT) family protein n=1 Tax=Mariniflexile fucanivorans TaxID=264023 RepID=A0A4R1RMN4_9FLAO|nr:GNAT family N-acetyltransferase [Mariniflexile fucanivorans]TCL67062.1 acetyltransferase (GNAT) family protein [Mariniflexile fucanivorans]
MNYTINQITSTETYLVRQPVLRSGKPIESCIFDGDDLNTTFHLGIYSENKLVGVCSFFKNNQPLITETFQYQLRGMAVLNEYQGLGLGQLILTYGENLLKKRNIQTIWCNAREKAIEFYKKTGYHIIGEPFLIKDIGLHYIMNKIL